MSWFHVLARSAMKCRGFRAVRFQSDVAGHTRKTDSFLKSTELVLRKELWFNSMIDNLLIKVAPTSIRWTVKTTITAKNEIYIQLFNYNTDTIGPRVIRLYYLGFFLKVTTIKKNKSYHCNSGIKFFLNCCYCGLKYKESKFYSSKTITVEREEWIDDVSA